AATQTSTNVALPFAGDAALLRPLLEDLLQDESYLEIRAVSNTPAQLAFAIKIDDQQAGRWETNLALALGKWTGARPVAAPGTHGWKLEVPGQPAAGERGSPITGRVELSRAGAWIVIGWSQR